MAERDMKGKFLPGHTKVGGSTKGSKWLANDLYPHLQENDVDPKDMLVKAMKGEEVPLSINEILRILEFCYAKKKPISNPKKPDESPPDEVEDYTHLLNSKKEDEDA